MDTQPKIGKSRMTLIGTNFIKSAIITPINENNQRMPKPTKVIDVIGVESGFLISLISCANKINATLNNSTKA